MTTSKPFGASKSQNQYLEPIDSMTILIFCFVFYALCILPLVIMFLEGDYKYKFCMKNLFAIYDLKRPVFLISTLITGIISRS